MLPPLAGARAKVQQAREHLQRFDVEAARFVQDHPGRWEIRWRSGNQDLLIEFGLQTTAVPTRIWTTIGDIIHNLRSSLDLLACDLAAANGKPSDDVHFPICRTDDNVGAAITGRRFQRAGSAAIAIVLALKPHRTGNPDLWGLHELDLRDKHRALVPAVTAVATPEFRVVDNGTKRTPQFLSDTRAPVPVRLTFPDGLPFAKEEVGVVLARLVGVVNSVIERFAVILPNPGASSDAPMIETRRTALRFAGDQVYLVEHT